MNRVNIHPSPGSRCVLLAVLLMIFACQVASSQGGDICFNEVMASNGGVCLDEDGDASDWIELHYTGGTTLNLQGYGLSDDLTRPFRWTFPHLEVQPGAYLVVWASGKDRTNPELPLHTNFSLSALGEPLLLSRPDGTTLDALNPLPLPRDTSYGRQPDGADDWFFFVESTPGEPNTTLGYASIAEPPVFSHSGGFHVEPFLLTLSSTHPGSTILYTLDGSVPEPWNLDGTTYFYKNQHPQEPGDPFGPLLTSSYETLLYVEPLRIADRSQDPNCLSIRSTTIHRSPASYAPVEPVFKGTVVRARAVREDSLPSEVVSHTYFVTPEGAARYELPVISLAIQEDHLFDHEQGIYVAGIDFETWRLWEPNTPSAWHSPANYRRTDIESSAHFELFEPALGRAFSMDVGVRIHGGASRFFPQKSMRLHARKSCDPRGVMQYPFFEGLTNRIDHRPISSFQSLILRNSGNDYATTRLRDAFIQTAVLAPMGLDHQAYRPAVHFINGEYWGLINIRERIDRHYIANHYDIDPGDAAILDSHRGILREGTSQDSEDWKELWAYATAQDLTQSQHWDYMEERIDLDNLIRYNVSQIYISNTDWPGNNLFLWRKRISETGSDVPAAYDGRWRWILQDTDFGFGGDASHNTLWTAAGGRHTPNPEPTLLLHRLLLNSTFRARFINAFADHLNTTFQTARVEALADAMHAKISSSLPEHISRWRDMRDTTPQILKRFAQRRPAWMWSHLVRFFDLVEVIPEQLVFAEDFEHWTDNDWSGWIQGAAVIVRAETTNPHSGAVCLWMKGAGFGSDPALLLHLPNVLEDVRHAHVRISGTARRISGAGVIRLAPRHGILGSNFEFSPQGTWQPFSRVVTLDWSSGSGDFAISASNGLEFLLDNLRVEQVHSPAGTATVTLDVSDPAHGHLQINSIAIDHHTPGLPDSTQPFPWSGLYFQSVPIRVTALPAAGYQFKGWEEYPDILDPSLEVLPDQDLQLTAHFEPIPVIDSKLLIHYWSFNDAEFMARPDYTVTGAELVVELGPHSEVLAGAGQGFHGENAQLHYDTGAHLRINDPLGSTLTFHLPTMGFERLQLGFETRRSSQGAGTQMLSYTTNGFDFSPLTTIMVSDDAPVLHKLDLSQLLHVEDNPDFALRITFSLNSGGTSGNNRFDNLTLHGVPAGTVHLPPLVRLHPGRLNLIQRASPLVLDLETLFLKIHHEPLEYRVASTHSAFASLTFNGAFLEVTPLRTGKAMVEISADDGYHPPVTISLPITVHPEPHPLLEQDFLFEAWAASQPAETYPAHMVFEQTTSIDPGLDVDLNSFWTLPYDLTSRSRIHGLGEYGLGFINTSNAQDDPEAGFVGSAIVALCTLEVEEVWVAWTGGTILPNDRVYGLRLQYRVGHSNPWTDVRKENGEPVEYIRHPVGGHATRFHTARLPNGLGNHEYVQLRWKYYHLSGSSGPRAHLRLNDIHVSPEPRLIDPPVDWPTPPPIVYGTALGDAQLTATSQVPGHFTYHPAAGTLLPVGFHVIESTFTPEDPMLYRTASSSVVLEVQPAPLIVRAEHAARTYREPNPPLGCSIEGLIPIDLPDVVSGVVLRTQAEEDSPAGYYPINAEGGQAHNYSIIHFGGLLTIHPAPLTIQVDDKTRPYATANPEWTYQVKGLLDGDDQSSVHGILLHTSATAETPAGDYPILAVGGAALNYTLHHEPGTLRIEPAAPILTWNVPQSIFAGTALTEEQLNATADVPGTFVYTPPLGSLLDHGPHTLHTVFTPDDSSNYLITTGQVTLAILEVPLGVVVQPASQTVFHANQVMLSVEANEPGSITYQWHKDNLEIPLATDPFLIIHSARLTDAGAYHVVITGPGGSVASEPAHLTVINIHSSGEGPPFQTVISIAGSVGNGYRIESTDSLLEPVRWQPWQTIELDVPTIEIIDDTAPTANWHFYRIIRQ
jgi:hypothetical protein